MKGCCASIGLTFVDDPADEKLLAFGIGPLVEQLDQASGSTWNAAMEAFAGLIQLRCMKWRPPGPSSDDKGCVVDGFDEQWFDDPGNKQGAIDDLVKFLCKNAIEV